MKKQKPTEIFYSLNIEDIQTVSREEIGRELSKDEIKKIKDLIVEKINWYYAIAYTIYENVEA